MNIRTDAEIDSSSRFSFKIDKIALVSGSSKRAHTDFSYDQIILLQENKRIPSIRVRSSKYYRVHAWFSVPFNNPLGTVLFQTGGYNPTGFDSRLEFNPTIIGPADVKDVVNFLSRVLRENPYSFIKKSKVTRLDIALDLTGLSLNDVIVHMGGIRKHGVFFGSKGRPETIYLGSPRSNCHLAVYDKTLPGEPFGLKALRIERRLKPHIPFEELVQLNNPFGTIQLISTASLVANLTEIPTECFFATVRERGFSRTIKLLSASQRRALKKAFEDPANSVMPPIDQIWQSIWPATVEQSVIRPASPIRQNVLVDHEGHFVV